MRTLDGVGVDDRGVSSTVTHALALGITAILISGLLFTAGSLLEDQRENSAREQLRTVGNRIADDLSRAAVLAQNGGNVTIRTRHPTSIAGRPYHVTFLTGSDCDTDLFDADACLDLELQDGRTSVMVPVRNETAVTFDRAAGGSYIVAATANDSAKQPSVPGVRMDLRVGIGEDIGDFSSGSSLNLTNRNPIAGFTFTPGQPAVGQVVEFRNDTEDLDGVITSYEWDLNGDGTVDETGNQVNHSYPSAGKYTVTLTVTDDDGETDSVSKVVSVGGLVYEEDAEASSLVPNSTKDVVNFSVTNKNAAEIEILEVLIDPDYDTIQYLETAPGYDPELEIDANPEDGGHDSPLEIYDGGRIFDIADDGDDGSATMGAGSTATVWFRGFEDASNTSIDMTGREVRVAMRYHSDGSYYTSQFTLFGPTAGNSPPDVSFTTSCSSAPTCSFDGTATDSEGPINSYQWNFGDGSTSPDEDPDHTFPSNGTYTVSLTATDDDGVSSTATKNVLVGDGGDPVIFAVNSGGQATTVGGVEYDRDTVGSPHQYHSGDNGADSTGDPIAGTSEDTLYHSTRLGDDDFRYDVPAPNGEYEVTLKFAEIDANYWVRNGWREVRVDIEGSPGITDLDVYDQAGGEDVALVRKPTTTVNDGTLSIDITRDSVLDTMVSAVVARLTDAIAFQESGGEVIMEAESYHRSVPGSHDDSVGDDMSGDSWVASGDSDASGGTALEGQPNNGDSAGDTENGPRLDYYVDFPASDTYYVWVRLNCAGAADDSVHVGLDGQSTTFGGSGLNKNATTYCHNTTGWMWASHAAGSQASVNVDSDGQHTLNVWMNDDGVEIDKIVLTNQDESTYVPTGNWSAESPES